MTITRVGDIFGNVLTFGAASIATITQDDLRLWAIALGGLSISLMCNLPRVRQRRYEAQEARLRLCAECRRDGTHSQSCVVEPKHRPSVCPLRKEGYGDDEKSKHC
ncbi:MAG: hypothetical protein J6T16_06550 [Opitutales bacterium]|nr:hypothetical protein [Opitutales bacterium]